MLINWLDCFISIVVCLSAIISFNRGFIKELLAITTWYLAFMAARYGYLPVAKQLPIILGDPAWNGRIIAISIFMAIFTLCSILNRMIVKLMHKYGFAVTDKVLGLILGAFKGIVILAILIFFLEIITVLPKQPWWQSSIFIPKLQLVTQQLLGVIDHQL